MADTTKQARDDEILKRANSRFRTIQSAESHIRTASLEDLHFCYNIDDGQWPKEIRDERQTDSRPCLTSNKLRKFVAGVANQERQNRVAIGVRPVDSVADPKTAQVYADLIRQIEYASSADEIYASAGENAIAGGFGYWRIQTRWVEDGFDQEIFLEWMKNPFAVHMDPRRNYCFISDKVTRDEFKVQYPNANMVDWGQQARGEEFTLWYEEDTVRVAEYYEKEPVEKVIAQIRNPVNGEVGVVELEGDVTEESIKAKGIEVIKTRKVKTHKVRWYKITGHEVLEEADIPSKEIPVIEVMGDEVNVAGKTYKRSLIRDAKDPQRMRNYWLTNATEAVALQPKAPYLVTPAQIQGFESDWDNADKKNLPYLRWNPLGGSSPPKRESPPQLSTGHMGMIELGDQDIQDTMGLYDSFVGQKSNERSGRAINIRKQGSLMGTLHFADNLRRSVVLTGRILIDMIPRVYDTERIVRIRGEDGNEELMPINQTIPDPENLGKKIIFNDISVGKYDVQADARQYSTRRQEESELILQAMQFAPNMAHLFVDLLFKNSDSPGAEEIEQRIKKFLATQGDPNNPGSTGKNNGTGGPAGPVPLSPEREAARAGPGG